MRQLDKLFLLEKCGPSKELLIVGHNLILGLVHIACYNSLMYHIQDANPENHFSIFF